MRQWGVNNLPKVVVQQRHGWGSNPRPLDRKSDALPLSHRATLATLLTYVKNLTCINYLYQNTVHFPVMLNALVNAAAVRS